MLLFLFTIAQVSKFSRAIQILQLLYGRMITCHFLSATVASVSRVFDYIIKYMCVLHSW